MTQPSEPAEGSTDASTVEVTPPVEGEPYFGWHTKRFLIAFYGLAIAFGLFDPAEESDMGFLLGVGTGFSMAWWAITDASDRGRPLRLSLRVLVILISWLATPLYLIWTQRLKGVFWIAVNTVGFLATTTLTFGASRALMDLMGGAF